MIFKGDLETAFKIAKSMPYQHEKLEAFSHIYNEYQEDRNLEKAQAVSKEISNYSKM